MADYHLWPGLLSRGVKYLRENGWQEFTIKLAEYRLNQLQPASLMPGFDTEQPAPAGGNRIPFNGYKVTFFLSLDRNRLSFPFYEQPTVSIILLTHNRADLTYDCLETVLAHSDRPYELIIIDNGSRDETGALLDRLAGIGLVRNTENRGFAAGCNQGAELARGKYLLFLNNDTQVTPGWLSGLVDLMDSTPSCGAVGAKLVRPDGSLQEAGSILGPFGEAIGYGRGDHPLKPEYSYVREVDFCSGACLLVRKELFQALGGFDERFSPAYYEDCDLCLGLAHRGYKVLYHPGVTVFHHEYAGSGNGARARRYMAQNRELLFRKWKPVLEKRAALSQINLLQVRDLRPGPAILYLDDRIPYPCQGSGFPRAFQILVDLVELGCRVTVLPTMDRTAWQPVTHELQMKGVEVITGEDPLDYENFLEERAREYPIVWVSRIHNLARFLPTLQRVSGQHALIYDSEAIFSRRELLKSRLNNSEADDCSLEENLSRELALMKSADLVITVSEQEKRIIQGAGIGEVEILGYSLPVREPEVPFNERKNLLFVGGFLSPGSPNEDAVLFFIQEIFPALHQQLQCQLWVVGYDPPAVIRERASESIRILGPVEDLQPYLDQCRVFVVPHRYAAGIPLKLYTAMAQGLPAVCFRVIAEQVEPMDFGQVLVAENTREFIDQTLRLYRDEQVWQQVQRNSLEFIRNNARPEQVRERLTTILARAKASRRDRVKIFSTGNPVRGAAGGGDR